MVPTPQAQSIVIDVIEYLTDAIIDTDDIYTRLETWRTLQTFWNALDNKQDFGRLYARYQLSKILTAVAHTDPYNQDDVSMDSLKPGKVQRFLSPPLPLVCWSRNHWTDLVNLLESTREVLLRKDADMLQGENEEEDETRAGSDLYLQKLDRLLMYIRVNQALVGFRASLEEQLAILEEQSGLKDGTVKVDPLALAKFGEIIETDFGDDADEKLRNALQTLLVRGGKPASAGSSTRSHGVSLVSAKELHDILRQKPFCLEMFARRVQNLLTRWAQDVFREKPILTRLGYSPGMVVGFAAAKVNDKEEESEEEEEDTKLPARESDEAELSIIAEESDDNDENESPPLSKKALRPKRKRDSSDSPKVVEELKRARQDLSEEGTDPLQESRRIAAKAIRTSHTLYEPKKSASKVSFGNVDSDDDSDDETGRAHLSDVPARAKLVPQKPKSPKKVTVSGEKHKRIPWTEQEKTAVKAGIEKYGKGKWHEIKCEYAVVLKNRTSVQIKDCARTLEKQGLI